MRKILFIFICVSIVMSAFGCVQVRNDDNMESTDFESEAITDNEQINWTSLDEVEKYSGIFDSEFVSIFFEDNLYNVTCYDEDILETWREYLTSIKVRREDDVSETIGQLDGGPSFVRITTASGETYSIRSYTDQTHDIGFVIDGIFYAKDVEGKTPYVETYALATERHGKYQNWDGEWVE